MGRRSNFQLRPRHGCLIVLAIFLLSLMLISRGCAKTIVRWSVTYSDPAPTFFYPPRGGDAEIDAALEKASQITDYLNLGHSAPNVSFTADELNLLVYYHPAPEMFAKRALADIRPDVLRLLRVLKLVPLDNLAERIRFDIRNDLLILQTSIPLDSLASSGLDTVNGRYLNAEVALDLSVVGGNLLLFVRDVKMSGDTLPDSFIQVINNENLAHKFASSSKDSGLLSLLRNVHIAEDKLFIAP